MNFSSIKEAVNFYIENGMRPMPIHSVHEKCCHKPYKPELDCRGQCWGKVPSVEHWPDKEIFTQDDFNDYSNLALIMGKQFNNKWYVGLDVDGELDLSEFLQLPETLECKTRRGKHLIYEVEPDAPLGNWNDIFKTRCKINGYKRNYQGAVDVKYCRGAMVSPPSLNKDGELYQWKYWRIPEHLPSSEMNFLLRKRKFAYPSVKRYRKWSLYPSHFGKRP